LELFCGALTFLLFTLSRMYMLFGFLVTVATNLPEFASLI